MRFPVTLLIGFFTPWLAFIPWGVSRQIFGWDVMSYDTSSIINLVFLGPASVLAGWLTGRREPGTGAWWWVRAMAGTTAFALFVFVGDTIFSIYLPPRWVIAGDLLIPLIGGTVGVALNDTD